MCDEKGARHDEQGLLNGADRLSVSDGWSGRFAGWGEDRVRTIAGQHPVGRATEPAITPVVVRMVILVWVFAVLMAATGHAMQGHDPFDFLLLNYIPPMAASIGWNLGLIVLLGRLDGRGLAVRLIVMTAAVLGVSAIQTIMDMIYNQMLALTVAPVWQDWALDLTSARFSFAFILYVWTFAFAVLLSWAMRAHDNARMNAARAAAFEAATLRAEANALRLQLNPHFLFNTLNSIASLTVSNRKAAAEEMINLLADFLRSSIGTDPSGETLLQEELATTLAYLRIEAVRFGERMTVETVIPPGLERAMTPNFILQPLAENAVKYGVATTRRPVLIRIEAAEEAGRLRLTVENRLKTGTAARPRLTHDIGRGDQHGLGLGNTRRRLALAYGDAARLDAAPQDDGYRVDIRMPLTWAADKAHARPRRRR